MPMNRVLVRRPGPRLAGGLVTHLERTPVDVRLASRQWEDYVGVLTAAGWSAVTALPDGTVLGYPPLVDDPGAFDSFMAVPEPSGAHVGLLDDDRLLMAASAPATAAAAGIACCPAFSTGSGYRPCWTVRPCP